MGLRGRLWLIKLKCINLNGLYLLWKVYNIQDSVSLYQNQGLCIKHIATIILYKSNKNLSSVQYVFVPVMSGISFARC